MKTKFIYFLITVLALTSFQSAFAQSSTSNCAGYSDVTTTDKYCEAIQYVTDQSIFSGSYSIDQYASGEKYFKPNDNINRAEVLKVILRAGGDATAYNEIKTYGSEVGFNDISATSSDWWLGFLKQAKAEGIIKGYGDNTFKATNPVSRVEFLKMLLEASPSKNDVHSWEIKPSIELWADTPITAWYAQYVAFANHYGLFAELGACEWGKVCPDRPLLRAEAAQMIFNYKTYMKTDLGIIENVACVVEGGAFNGTVNPPTQCCPGLISYFPLYSKNVSMLGAGGVCLGYDADLEDALAIYNTENDCTTNLELGQTTSDLPYKNQNFNGYSFPMKSFKDGCGARCDVDLDTQTATIGWMCTGLIVD